MPSQPSTTPVEAVLFDYGLVLTGPPHPPAWERMKALLHTEEAPFHAAYWRPRHAYDLGELSGESFWLAVAQEVGQAPDEQTIKALLDADTELWTQPNRPMIDWAAALQATGVRTGILSNLGDVMETGVLAACPWLLRFDHLTFSHRLGIAKPDLAIYRHAAEGLELTPAQILFIDDRADNIEGAKQAGMQTIQYTDHTAFERAMHDAGLGLLLTPATKV